MSKPTALPRQALFTAAESAAFRYGTLHRGGSVAVALIAEGHGKPYAGGARDPDDAPRRRGRTRP